MSGPIIIHSDDYANWVFDEHHPTQGRRFINGYNAVLMNIDYNSVWDRSNVYVQKPRPASIAELRLAHSEAYINQVIGGHECGEWADERPDLARLAQFFVGGTIMAVHELLDGKTNLAIHLPGAKHHAMRDYSSGFCVFADFAIAARIARENGERVAILDIDAHHGDGTETLLLDSQEILTYSVHQWGIFPGTGLHDIPESQAYNTPLPAEAGNHELMMAVKRFITLCDEFQPSIVFIAAGADGAWFDPLSELRYTVDGMASSVRQVREQYPWMPILMGGAGGYLPDGGTPLAWGAMAGALI